MTLDELREKGYTFTVKGNLYEVTYLPKEVLTRLFPTMPGHDDMVDAISYAIRYGSVAVSAKVFHDEILIKPQKVCRGKIRLSNDEGWKRKGKRGYPVATEPNVKEVMEFCRQQAISHWMYTQLTR